MSPKEKAEDLITKFHQYDWDEVKGWTPNEQETKKMVGKVIDEIEACAEEWGVTSLHWKAVRKEVNHFFA